MHEVLAEEDGALGAPGHRADAFAHAPFAHHAAGDLGGAHEVVLGARGLGAEHDLLGDAPPMNTPSESCEVFLVVRVALLDRHLLRHPSAMPVGRIVTLCTGSACSNTYAATGVPVP